MRINVDNLLSGITVSELLTKRLCFSHKSISRLKRIENGIVLNGVHVTVRAELSEGDILEIRDSDTEDEVNNGIVPSDIPLDIIYEDDYIVVPNKPGGMPTHPSFNHYDDSLANALVYYYKQKDIPFVFRAVNRLDRDTSGICLIAKNKQTSAALSDSIAAGRVRKKYIALLDGKIEPESGEITCYIRRKEKSIITREAIDYKSDDSQYAHTVYRLISYSDVNNISCVECEPLTGRTHQLRVQFAYLNYPITGDTLYGKISPLISRQALHACSISFIHPMTGKEIHIDSPLPDDMKRLVGDAL